MDNLCGDVERGLVGGGVLSGVTAADEKREEEQEKAEAALHDPDPVQREWDPEERHLKRSTRCRLRGDKSERRQTRRTCQAGFK